MADSPHSLIPSKPFDAHVLELLACPVCFGQLRLSASGGMIECAGCGRSYPVVDGIPVLIAGRDL